MSKLINQGGFGCIFHPGFNCKGKTTKRTNDVVTKLQINDFNGHNEIYIGSLLKTVYNHALYFLPVISSCSIGLAALNQKSVDKCKIVSKDNDNYLLLELSYIKNITFKQLFSDSFRTNKHLFVTFIETFSYITNSIEHLLEKNIVHFDIKEGNILYSIKYENPILIDFGISIPIDKLTNENLSDYFYVYGPEYYIWPMEVHVINYLLHVNDVLTLDTIKSIVEKSVSNNIGLNIFSDEFKKQYKLLAINYFKKYIDTDKFVTIKELVAYYKTWDLYALSIMYLKFFQILFKDGFFESKFVIAFAEILLTNISPDPNKRISIADTIKKYVNIFYINETQINYEQLVNNLDYHLVK